eukprot:SAG31_NODE_31559_length_366_cov_2.610487_2_plen_35_part_01
MKVSGGERRCGASGARWDTGQFEGMPHTVVFVLLI